MLWTFTFVQGNSNFLQGVFGWYSFNSSNSFWTELSESLLFVRLSNYYGRIYYSIDIHRQYFLCSNKKEPHASIKKSINKISIILKTGMARARICGIIMIHWRKFKKNAFAEHSNIDLKKISCEQVESSIEIIRSWIVLFLQPVINSDETKSVKLLIAIA